MYPSPSLITGELLALFCITKSNYGDVATQTRLILLRYSIQLKIVRAAVENVEQLSLYNSEIDLGRRKVICRDGNDEMTGRKPVRCPGNGADSTSEKQVGGSWTKTVTVHRFLAV
jgi:hypothetical protein